jgi:hypothetical protein
LRAQYGGHAATCSMNGRAGAEQKPPTAVIVPPSDDRTAFFAGAPAVDSAREA